MEFMKRLMEIILRKKKIGKKNHQGAFIVRRKSSKRYLKEHWEINDEYSQYTAEEDTLMHRYNEKGEIEYYVKRRKYSIIYFK